MTKMFTCLALFMLVAVSHAQEAPQLSIDGSWTLKLPYLELEMQNGKKAYSATLISEDGGTTFVVDTDSIEEIAVYEKRVLSEKAENVWSKAEVILGEDSDVVRKDKCGAKIKKAEYGCRQFQYGWEIDHIQPKDDEGSDDLSNLQPLHWKNNASKSDKLDWDCEITPN